MDVLADVDFAKEKIRAALSQLSQLKAADFPYDEPRFALELLEKLYERDLLLLQRIDNTTHRDIRQQACEQVNSDLTEYLPILGFLLRATNVRNAFEIYDPLLRICKKLCGSDAKLILSSEWSYSPFTYPAWFQDLPGVIFIGLPATETGNALIVPAAGHELGHSVWSKKSLATMVRIRSAIEKKLTSEIISAYVASWTEFEQLFEMHGYTPPDLTPAIPLRNVWQRSFRLALRQVEELFCDALGLRIFGEGFFYSFLYLVGPHLSEPSSNYPLPSLRIKALSDGGKRFGVVSPPGFADFFAEPQRTASGQIGFIVRMADTAIRPLIDDILNAADNYAVTEGITLPSDSERDRILSHFRSLSPATGARTLAEIINAGWQIRLDWSHWNEYKIDQPAAFSVLNDLLYKTVEVMEYETRVGASSAS